MPPSLLAALTLLATTAAAQGGGFWENCTSWSLGWEGETVYRRFMVAECTDEAGDARASFLPLNYCVANREGEMLPEKRSVFLFLFLLFFLVRGESCGDDGVLAERDGVINRHLHTERLDRDV